MKEIDDAFEEYSRNVERAYEKLRVACHRDVSTFTTVASTLIGLICGIMVLLYLGAGK